MVGGRSAVLLMVLVLVKAGIMYGREVCGRNCDLVNCEIPQGCLYGTVTETCQCCPTCAQGPLSPLADVIAGDGLRKKRSPRFAVGTAQRVAKQHKHIVQGGIPKEFLEQLRRKKAKNRQ
ncbi:hypothetical protein OTU49_001195 [Cherax quadricarinatus]|uniref:Uncharacterized protein n=1 Tax=Cherax quadricarinatus TaxID=27406 RepID=A0AAW0XIJ0_CHEQU|nr:uncharacterized protein LOC128690875 [Cherax quadricarinatus]XP_053635606.1 uncharacterized protein LOC128690875 [Cherax quadricarinatus]XP_053635607.1 uncharacterized protein LOC128690875 [Cherax quadricarinatus]